MDPLTLACNGCQHGSKLHTQWEKFEADVDDVLPIATRKIATVNSNDNTDSHCTWIEGYSRMQLQEEQLKDSVTKNLIELMKHGPPERNHIVKERVQFTRKARKLAVHQCKIIRLTHQWTAYS